jgi:hypothetical protein
VKARGTQDQPGIFAGLSGLLASNTDSQEDREAVNNPFLLGRRSEGGFSGWLLLWENLTGRLPTRGASRKNAASALPLPETAQPASSVGVSPVIKILIFV